MRSHAGAARAPHMPIRNDVASSESGFTSPAEIATAKAIEITVTAASATIRSRRGSTTSVSAPAGKVRRKNGRVVTTWTAETSLGLGLRLVISQAEPVSYIANPTLENEVAIENDHERGIAEQARARLGARWRVRVDVQFGSHVIRPVSGRCPASGICVPPLGGFGKREGADARRAYRCSLRNAPACASARRPGSSRAFHSGHAWIM